MWPALGLALELGYLIAIPIVVLAFMGRFLDREFGTAPWMLLGGILLAIIASGIGITRKVRKMIV